MKIFSTLFFLIGFSTFIVAQSPFRYIVASDGSGDFKSVQAALDACPDGERSLIFIKNGTYAEQVSLGSKSAVSTKKISLIGESRNGVLITHSQSRGGSGSPTFEDICTVKLYATDFYAENITIQNAAGNTGMAEALYTAGDRQTFKNCTLLGYQDTYRSKKGTRGYFLNSWIEGAVDFIYAGGTIIFEDCTINCVKGGGYITAPEDAFTNVSILETQARKSLRLGFLFRNCLIAAEADVGTNTYYLGRPWNNYAGSFYVNCKLGNHIRPIGWQTWGGNETTACFAEYNSMDLAGNPIDISNRAAWSFQLPKSDVDNFLNPEYFYSKGYATAPAYDPVAITISPSTPVIIENTTNSISWQKVDGAAGYLIFKNGIFLKATTETAFTDPEEIPGNYSVKSINSIGVLSDFSSNQTNIISIKEAQIIREIRSDQIIFDRNVDVQLFGLSGKKLKALKNVSQVSTTHFPKGWYIIKISDKAGLETSGKLKIN